jgi:hypothetical protein
MSECLYETINRLKENSLVRERMYGEYECAMLLQHLMLQKNIDACRSDAVAVKAITFFSESPRGLLFDCPKTEKADLFAIHMAEAHEEGFEGMYKLLTDYKLSKEMLNPSLQLLFNRETSLLQFQTNKLPLPLFWSLDKNMLIEPKDGVIQLESGDLFFLFNTGLLNFFKYPQKIQDLISKVLKVFAQDGFETVVSMLQKEIALATKRKGLPGDIHLLCFQILNP